jgi:hypothetical protein
LVALFVELDYKGWLLLEAGGAPKDPIKALKEQKALFQKMVADAQAKS